MSEHKKRKVKAICPTCNEHLGKFGDEGDFDAAWWAGKAVGEHMAEYHD